MLHSALLCGMLKLAEKAPLEGIGSGVRMLFTRAGAMFSHGTFSHSFMYHCRISDPAA